MRYNYGILDPSVFGVRLDKGVLITSYLKIPEPDIKKILVCWKNYRLSLVNLANLERLGKKINASRIQNAKQEKMNPDYQEMVKKHQTIIDSLNCATKNYQITYIDSID